MQMASEVSQKDAIVLRFAVSQHIYSALMAEPLNRPGFGEIYLG